MHAADDSIVFLLDVDNTLLDNDRFSDDLDARLERDFGAEGRRRYRGHYEALRAEAGYADYLGAVQRLREEFGDAPELLRLAAFILDYPFADRLYPHALDAIAYLGTLGMPVILSDGDLVLQPRKLQRSGLWDAVAGRVSICLHKQRRLDAVRRRWPARHYVMVDDKAGLLAAMKRDMGVDLATVFVRQGHYAHEQKPGHDDPAPDIVLEHVGDLRAFARGQFLDAAVPLASGHRRPS